MVSVAKQGVGGPDPSVRKRPKKTIEHHHAVGILRGRRLVFQRRSDKGRWAGLWQLPTVESDKRLEPAEIRSRLDFDVHDLSHIESFERVLTHRRIRFHVYRARMQAGQRLGSNGSWHGFVKDQMPPLGVAQRKTLDVLEKCLKGA